jgi:hypothetical protein
MENGTAPFTLEHSCRSNRIHCHSGDDGSGSSGSKHPRRPRRRVVTRRLSILAPQHYHSCHARINPTDVTPRNVRFPLYNAPTMTDNIFSRQQHHHCHADCHQGGKSAGPAAVTPNAALPTAVSVAADASVMTTQREYNITEDDAVAVQQVDDNDTAAGGLFVVRREDVHVSSGGDAAPMSPTPTHYTAAASLVHEKQPPHDPNDDSDGSRIVG